MGPMTYPVGIWNPAGILALHQNTNELMSLSENVQLAMELVEKY